MATSGVTNVMGKNNGKRDMDTRANPKPESPWTPEARSMIKASRI